MFRTDPRQALALSGILVFGLLQAAGAESRSSYNRPVSGITVEYNGATSDVSSLFGFKTTSNQVTIGGTSYHLNDVRKFVLLYDVDPTTGIPSPLTTTGVIGNVGTQKRWTGDSSTAGGGAFYGWQTTNGTLKDGQFQPGATGFDTTKVFSLSGPLSGTGSKNLVGFGFDVSVNIGSGQIDPFANGTPVGAASTGFVYQSLASPVPEAGTILSFGGFLAAGGMGMWMKRTRRKQA